MPAKTLDVSLCGPSTPTLKTVALLSWLSFLSYTPFSALFTAKIRIAAKEKQIVGV